MHRRHKTSESKPPINLQSHVNNADPPSRTFCCPPASSRLQFCRPPSTPSLSTSTTVPTTDSTKWRGTKRRTIRPSQPDESWRPHKQEEKPIPHPCPRAGAHHSLRTLPCSNNSAITAPSLACSSDELQTFEISHKQDNLTLQPETPEATPNGCSSLMFT